MRFLSSLTRAYHKRSSARPLRCSMRQLTWPKWAPLIGKTAHQAGASAHSEVDVGRAAHALRLAHAWEHCPHLFTSMMYRRSPAPTDCTVAMATSATTIPPQLRGGHRCAHHGHRPQVLQTAPCGQWSATKALTPHRHRSGLQGRLCVKDRSSHPQGLRRRCCKRIPRQSIGRACRQSIDRACRQSNCARYQIK